MGFIFDAGIHEPQDRMNFKNKGLDQDRNCMKVQKRLEPKLTTSENRTTPLNRTK